VIFIQLVINRLTIIESWDELDDDFDVAEDQEEQAQQPEEPEEENEVTVIDFECEAMVDLSSFCCSAR
jgi:hypothetical protein